MPEDLGLPLTSAPTCDTAVDNKFVKLLHSHHSVSSWRGSEALGCHAYGESDGRGRYVEAQIVEWARLPRISSRNLGSGMLGIHDRGAHRLTLDSHILGMAVYQALFL